MKRIDVFQRQKVLGAYQVVVTDMGSNVFRLVGRADSIRNFTSEVCESCLGVLLDEPIKLRKKSGQNPFGFLNCQAGGSGCLQLCQYLDDLSKDADGGVDR